MGFWTPASRRRKGGRCVGVTKGTKRSILVDRHGAPLSFTLECANRPRTEAGGPGSGWRRGSWTRPRALPEKSGPAIGRPRGGRPPFRKHSGPHGYRLRYIVERTNAWLGFERRIQVRHDRLIEACEGFFALACIKIVLLKIQESSSMNARPALDTLCAGIHHFKTLNAIGINDQF